MAKSPSPLVGYNTNVRHKGKLFHIQTEDSGVNRPHIITQLFADGGRIIALEKTTYDEHLDSDDLASIVKRLMQDQHKRVFISLRDGVYDADGEVSAVPETPSAPTTEVLDHAAARLVSDAPGAPKKFEPLRPVIVGKSKPSLAPGKLFGEGLLSDKTLDEVILAYLTKELDVDS
ncbi:MAG: hypothetical protein R3A47_02200 [Polyangiales bacterium]